MAVRGSIVESRQPQLEWTAMPGHAGRFRVKDESCDDKGYGVRRPAVINLILNAFRMVRDS